jgi:mRNA interferase YafQ
MLTIKRTSQFKRDFRKIIRQGYDTRIFFEIIDKLARQEKLEEKYNDHALKGNLKKFRECHIAPDWLLIYSADDENLILTLTRTGNKS